MYIFKLYELIIRIGQYALYNIHFIVYTIYIYIYIIICIVEVGITLHILYILQVLNGNYLMGRIPWYRIHSTN